MPPEDKPAVLQAITALVEEGEERVRVSCSIQSNYPYELLPMDVSMRYATQGIIASLRPLHAPVPVTPAGHGHGQGGQGRGTHASGGGMFPPSTPTGGAVGDGEEEQQQQQPAATAATTERI